MQASLALLGGEQGLLLDECGWKKVGHKSVSVARQYIGQVGKVSNGQVGVFAMLCQGIEAELVDGQLYPPTAWSTDAARCAQARIPAAVQTYRSKPTLAAELVKHLLGSGLVGTDQVGGDAAYGNSPALRQTMEDHQQAYVLDVRPGLSRPGAGQCLAVLHVSDGTQRPLAARSGALTGLALGAEAAIGPGPAAADFPRVRWVAGQI